MKKLSLKKTDRSASPSPKEMSRRFLSGFLVSLVSLFLASAIYYLFNQRFVGDLTAEILMGSFVLIGVLVGWWMIRTGEKHVGLGVIFGSVFGIILIILAAMLLALYLVAYPVAGH